MKKAQVSGQVCALCLAAKPLVLSHIIPKFKFRKIKGKSGQYHVLSANPAAPRRKDQKEFVEPLLCEHCDNVVINDGEKYLAKLLFGEPGAVGVADAIQGGTGLWNIEVDFGRVQRALFSILWRMDVSSQEIFKMVDLGPKHSEALRRSILTGIPLDASAYPISCAMPLLDGTHYSDVMATPHVHRTDNNRFYVCLIAGFVFSFVIGSAGLPPFLRDFILREDGTMPIARDELSRMPALYDVFVQAIKARK